MGTNHLMVKPHSNIFTGNEMEKETKNDVEYLNHDPNWLKTIIIEIDKLLTYREYINFFMKIYMQWSKVDGSTSSFRTLIISRLPCFEKLNFLQFQLYIETQITTQCFVCRNCKNTIVIRDYAVKENIFVSYTC